MISMPFRVLDIFLSSSQSPYTIYKLLSPIPTYSLLVNTQKNIRTNQVYIIIYSNLIRLYSLWHF